MSMTQDVGLATSQDRNRAYMRQRRAAIHYPDYRVCLVALPFGIDLSASYSDADIRPPLSPTQREVYLETPSAEEGRRARGIQNLGDRQFGFRMKCEFFRLLLGFQICVRYAGFSLSRRNLAW